MKPTVNFINSSVQKSADDFIAFCENRYHDELRALAREIKQNGNKKIVMIAGPSGSGKTTTAKILRDYLDELSIHTSVISLDDFYLNREDAPRDETGKPDFETVHSLDIPEICRCFDELIKNGYSDLPVFDFEQGRRKNDRQGVSIRDGGIIIVEGLHALNPLLTDRLPVDTIFKIYISVNDSVVDDDGRVVLSSRQMRLVRRMSRDDIYRGTTPQQTFNMWESVIKGEEKFLYCFKPTADRQIKTLHYYEPCIFRDRVLTLLKGISPESEDYYYVQNTIKGLECFCSVDSNLVPHDSLLREFIHGGKYE